MCVVGCGYVGVCVWLWVCMCEYVCACVSMCLVVLCSDLYSSLVSCRMMITVVLTCVYTASFFRVRRMCLLSNLPHCYSLYWQCAASVPQDIAVNRQRLQAVADSMDRPERALASASRLATEMAEVFEASIHVPSQAVVSAYRGDRVQ